MDRRRLPPDEAVPGALHGPEHADQRRAHHPDQLDARDLDEEVAAGGGKPGATSGVHRGASTASTTAIGANTASVVAAKPHASRRNSWSPYIRRGAGRRRA